MNASARPSRPRTSRRGSRCCTPTSSSARRSSTSPTRAVRSSAHILRAVFKTFEDFRYVPRGRRRRRRRCWSSRRASATREVHGHRPHPRRRRRADRRLHGDGAPDERNARAGRADEGASSRRRDRVPRAGLQRRRPARDAAVGGRRARGARGRGAGVVVDLRHRPGRRGARPARRSSTPACGSRPRSAPRSCSTPARPSRRSSGGAAGGPRHGPRAIDVDLLLLGRARARARERLTLPHAQATSRRFVLIPLVELDFDLATPDGRAPERRLAALPRGRGRAAGRPPLGA